MTNIISTTPTAPRAPRRAGDAVSLLVAPSVAFTGVVVPTPPVGACAVRVPAGLVLCPGSSVYRVATNVWP